MKCDIKSESFSDDGVNFLGRRNVLLNTGNLSGGSGAGAIDRNASDVAARMRCHKMYWLYVLVISRISFFESKMPRVSISISVLRRIQRISALIFLVFLVVHLLNTFLAVFGPDTYDSFQALMRAWYQKPMFEGLVVFVPLVVHVIAGLIKRRLSRQSPPTPLHRRMHAYSGIFLSIVILGHVAATRGTSWATGIYPKFEGIAFTVEWVPAYFYPYYFLFVVAAVYHAWYGVTSIVRPELSTAHGHSVSLWLPTLISGALVAASLLAFGGFIFDTGDPAKSDYAEFVLGWFE